MALMRSKGHFKLDERIVDEAPVQKWCGVIIHPCIWDEENHPDVCDSYYDAYKYEVDFTTAMVENPPEQPCGEHDWDECCGGTEWEDQYMGFPQDIDDFGDLCDCCHSICFDHGDAPLSYEPPPNPGEGFKIKMNVGEFEHIYDYASECYSCTPNFGSFGSICCNCLRTAINNGEMTGMLVTVTCDGQNEYRTVPLYPGSNGCYYIYSVPGDPDFLAALTLCSNYPYVCSGTNNKAVMLDIQVNFDDDKYVSGTVWHCIDKCDIEHSGSWDDSTVDSDCSSYSISYEAI